jgi:glycosyltransferase involved in cell wall biosynthesis
LRAARRAVRPFELDILDGGVSAPVSVDGLFFEEVAVYPASRILNGYIFAVIGLLDYVALTNDSGIAALIQRSHDTLHELMSEFDAGYWSRYDQLHQELATPFYHAVHVTLLEVLSRSSGCERCAAVASRWAAHDRRRSSRLRYLIASRGSRYLRGAWRRLRHALLRVREVDGQTAPDLVCVPIAAFPVAGGTRSVLAGVAQAMAGEWEMEYLTNQVGPHTEGMAIRPFGHAGAVPWRFPNVWLYVFSGWSKLLSLIRQGERYRLILPQDGAFTGAFAGVVGKMLGVRVVCMDHGNVTLPYSPAFRAEREQASTLRRRPQRLLWRLRDACYVPSLRLFAYIAARCADHYLPAGDDVAEAHVRQYGVHPSRITRFPFLVDVARFTPSDDAIRIQRRAQYGLAADAIVVTMVNRLAPEKNVDLALRGLSQALQMLPRAARIRVRMMIAGEGPLRAQIEAAIRRHGLDATCTLLGEATPDDVSQLLGVSDIFLYTGTRGINPVAVLEAMAAGCGVIATTAPRMVATYLAENRGIAIPPGDAPAVAMALSQAITDLPRCRQMGRRAREYVTARHTAQALRRALRRGTFWAPNIEEMASTAMPQAGAWRAEQRAALSRQQVAVTGDSPGLER